MSKECIVVDMRVVKRILQFFFRPNAKDRARLVVISLLIVGIIGGGFVAPNFWNKQKVLPQMWERPFSLGLDLQGGTLLVYKIEFGDIREGRAEIAAGIRDVIERRINLFGVSEPVVQVDRKGEEEFRLIVELAGIKDIDEAVKLIGETPSLDFRTEKDPSEGAIEITADDVSEEGEATLPASRIFQKTGLDGSHLEGARMEFGRRTSQPFVSLQFNDEGAAIFEKLTQENLGERVGIFVDDNLISAPTVQSVISGGQARITGQFSVEEAKTLAQRLQAGALPVPISLLRQNLVGASLGQESLAKSLSAGLWTFLLVALFMIIFYRLPGFLAVAALAFYGVLILSLFKLIPVTLTLAGIAGFILSVGMAVDANILIFERFKEEKRKGRTLQAAIDEGTKEAWQAIRDGNITTLITALILFWLGTGFIKGFALTLGLGILVSMFTAMIMTRLLMKTLASEKARWLWP